MSRIVVNTRFSDYAFQEGYGQFVHEISRRLVSLCPDDRFWFLSDRRSVPAEADGPSVRRVALGPPARHPLLWKWWYDVRVPLCLRRVQADVFLSPDGICSLRTRVPQVLVVHDLAFLRLPRYMPPLQQRFYRHYTPLFIRKASRVITVSEFSREDICKAYPFARGKVEVVPNAADPAFRPMEASDREYWKERYAQGREYFLCVGSIHPRKNLLNLLKAFSAFKKRQRTNMMLVIAGRAAWQHEPFTEALSTFRFRNDVVLTGYLPKEELTGLTGAAYASVYPSLWEGFGIPVLEAMQSGVPVLCADNTALPGLAGDAALYFDPADPEDMSRQLSRVYKDEAERSALIVRGRARAEAFDWNLSAAKVGEILREVARAGANP